MAHKIPIEERLARYSRPVPNGCIEWAAGRDRDGYGVVDVDGRQWRVPRLVYVLQVGEIPEGMQIDHLCRNRACFRVEHLEVVTTQENTRRRDAARTHCIRGHLMIPENRYYSQGKSTCKVCILEYHHPRYRARQAVA